MVPVALGLWLATACGIEPLRLDEVERATTGPPPPGHYISYQSASYDGTSFLGITYQGSRYQGATYLSTNLQGATYAGSPLSDVQVDGTALTVWRQLGDLTWERRTPDLICHWNASRTEVLSCTGVDLSTAPSPLTGITWSGTFLAADGTTFQGPIVIGASASVLGALHTDPTTAAFALNGSAASGCELVAQGPECDLPGGCRRNCDVWMYDVRLADVVGSDGQPAAFCPPGESAIALAGTWLFGGVTSSSTAFTLACESGTITKCARWGYRPWDSAVMSDGATVAALAPYHQACISAATADYCYNGHSLTRSGTLVDIYDYQPPQHGFIPSTRSLVGETAFAWEATFDTQGAYAVNRTRYEGIARGVSGTLDSTCPTRFAPTGLGSDSSGVRWQRSSVYGPHGPPSVSIDSALACPHTEQFVGQWISPGCSQCAQIVHDFGHSGTSYPNAYCTSAEPINGKTNAWDASCVTIAAAHCPATSRMGPHNECTTGAALPLLTSACTEKVETYLLGHYGYCGTSTWDSTCVAMAYQLCSGGQEGFNRVGQRVVGFCGPTTPIKDL